MNPVWTKHSTGWVVATSPDHIQGDCVVVHKKDGDTQQRVLLKIVGKHKWIRKGETIPVLLWSTMPLKTEVSS